MKTGEHVRIVCDDWQLNGKVGTVVNPRPVANSTRCYVDVDNKILTLAEDDLVSMEPPAAPRAAPYLRIAL